MVLSKENIYAFDECSIIHLCEIRIPESHRVFCKNKEILTYRNFSELSKFTNKLKENKISIYKFIPSSFENNLIKSVNNLLLDNNLNIQMLGRVFKTEINEQITEFLENLEGFEDILKSDNIVKIKQLFCDNERELKKFRRGYSNVPEDDDCKILKGFLNYRTSGEKFLITEDEHFFGYSDLIYSNFAITIIEESQCAVLISDS